MYFNLEPKNFAAPLHSGELYAHKWSHPVLKEHKFQNEWAAIESARCLAFDLEVYDGIHTSAVPVPKIDSRTSLSPPHRKVGFVNEVDVLIGSENDINMHLLKVPLDYLSLRISPWRTPTPYFHLGELEPLSAMAVLSPPQLEIKINRDEDPLLMDPSDGSDSGGDRPRRRNDPRRPPLHTMPGWIAELWNLLQEQGAIEMAEEGPVMYLQSYYLSHATHPREPDGRPLRFDREYVDWAQEIMAIWEDLWDTNAPFDLHLVRPDPPVQATQGTVGIVLLVQHQRPDRVACLTTTAFNELPRLRIVHVAHSMPHWMTPRQILECGQALQICDQLQWQGHARCTIQAGRRHYSFDHDIRIHDGLGLLINVPPPYSPQEWEVLVLQHYGHQLQRHIPEIANDPPAEEPHDETTLMARTRFGTTSPRSTRSTSSSTSPQTSSVQDEWKQTVVYSLDRQSKELDLPWNDGSLLKDKIAEGFGCAREAVHQTHFISHPPQDLIDSNLQGMLLQRSHEEPQVEFLRLTLLDVEYQADRRGPQERIARYAKWIPRRSTRISIIRLAGFEGHCFPPPDRCTLHHNHRQVFQEHLGPINIRHGDYLRITVPSHPDEPDEDLCQEDSPEPDPEAPADEFSTLQKSSVLSPSQTHAALWSNFSKYQPRAHSTSSTPLRPIPDQRSGNQRPFERPSPVQPQNWLLPARVLFVEKSCIEYADEGPVATWKTWFLHQERYPRNAESRLLRLDAGHRFWFQDLCDLWGDLYEPTRPAQVHVVHPQPPTEDHPPYIGHLIMVQHTDTVVPALLTALVDHPVHRRIWHTAVLLPPFLHSTDIAAHLGIERWCNLRICRLHYGRHEYIEDQVIAVEEGNNFVVTITNEARPVEESDEAELFQQPFWAPMTTHLMSGVTPSSHALNLDCSSSPEGRSFSLNPQAEPFHAQMPLMDGTPDHIQQLHQRWHQLATAWEDEERTCSVLTWFVDHRWQWPHCDRPRRVLLRADYTEWEEHLKQSWNAILDPNCVLQFHVVQPDPPAVYPDIVVHVILAPEAAEGLAMIQTQAIRKQVKLEAALPVTESEASIAITLLHEDGRDMNPPFITVPKDCSTQTLHDQMMEWNLTQHYVAVLTHEYVFLLDPQQDVPVWIYLPDSPETFNDKFFRRWAHAPDAHDHMRFLHDRGHPKAVIVRQEQRQAHVFLAFYVDVVALPPDRPSRLRTRTAWATPQPLHWDHSVIYDEGKIANHVPDCTMNLGISLPELQDFFTSASDILYDNLHDHDLPEICRALLDNCVTHTHIDRLVIYADGSSQAQHRRRPPQWIDENDLNDSWCFAVFGENYQSEQLMFLGIQCQQVIYDPDAHHYAGTEHIGADAAEREALLWASLWRLAQNHRLPTLFRTDSSLTRGQATGDLGTLHDHLPLRLLRATFQALEAVLPGDLLRVEHVMGHAGDALNELVDHFAKQEATKSQYLRRQNLNLRRWETALPHLWMVLTSAPDVPNYTPRGFDVQAPDLPVVAVDQLSSLEHSETTLKITISACSANVRSLYAGPLGHAGKLDFLRQQMKFLHLNFVGLQESRSTVGASRADGVLRLSSGALQGQLGVELWVNLEQPFAYDMGHPLFFCKDDFVVVHASPRLLLVLHDHPMLRFWLLVAHGPHSGRDAEEREEWWHTVSALLFQHVQSDQIYILIDANASTGECDQVHVFEHDDAPSVSTPFLRDFLRVHELCIPSTSPLHDGPHHTWTSPIDGTGYRIDYIFLRQTDLAHCQMSKVLLDFDLGHQGDHEPVAVQLEWTQLWHRSPAPSTASRVGYQRDKITQALLNGPLHEYAPLPWTTDIDTQVQHMNAYLHQTLRRHCRPAKREPKKSFITPDLWHLRSCRIQDKRKMQQLQKLLRREVLVRVFQAWRQCPCEVQENEAQSYFTTLLCSKLRLFVSLHCKGHELRRRLQKEKGQALNHRLKTMAPETPASTILHELKSVIGSTNRKKQQRPPLPWILTPDGTPCQSTQQLRDCWINFFQQMECGQRLGDAALRRLWRSNLSRFRQPSADISGHEIPSLYDLEAAFRKVQNAKATGQDGVPSELCHSCPVALARIVYTQLLKLCFHGQEALQHKGGQLVMAYKHKGAQNNPTSYRSLMISSHIAKTIHRCLRLRQATYYERYPCRC
eukprot:s1266_g21.t1